MKLTTTALCILAAFLLSPVQSEGDDSSCFKQQGKGEGAIEFIGKVYAVSPTRTCGDQELECDASSENVHVTAERFLNVTTDKADEIFDVISDATSITFEESLSGEAGTGGGCDMMAGNTTYIAFVPGFYCVEGILGDCVEGLEEDLPVKACHPATLNDDNENIIGLMECIFLNATNGPDVKFKPVGSASILTPDMKMLFLLSLLAAGGFLAFPSL